MSMTADLRDRLKAAVANGHVYRDERPQGSALPAVIVRLASDPRPSNYAGREATRRTLVQIDCLAESRGAADDLAEQVIAIAETAATVGQTKFQRSFVDGQRNTFGIAEDGKKTFESSLDLSVWHSPAN